jgi:hypothetical protein
MGPVDKGSAATSSGWEKTTRRGTELWCLVLARPEAGAMVGEAQTVIKGVTRFQHSKAKPQSRRT